MPRTTPRSNAILSAYLRMKVQELEPDTSENLLILMDIHDELNALLSSRWLSRPSTYAVRERSLNNANGFVNGVPLTPNEVRLNADEFQDLLRRVEPVWLHSESGRGRRQAPINLQLACFLYRLAHKSLSFYRVADKFNITHGSASTYFYRGAYAVAELASEVVRWPDADRRAAISANIESESGLPSCVGFIDSVHVVLDHAPALDKQRAAKFYDRKGTYSLMMLAACDETKRFTFFHAGYNGAASDMRAQRDSTLMTAPERLFSKGEYLLGSAGFECSEYIIPLYEKPPNTAFEPRMEYFNTKAAKPHAKIEHAFGMLKLRWQMLKSFGARLGNDAADGDEEDFRLAWTVVIAALVLHNLYIATAPPYELTQDEIQTAVDKTQERADAIPEEVNANLGDGKRREQVAWLTALGDKTVDAPEMRRLFPRRHGRVVV